MYISYCPFLASILLPPSTPLSPSSCVATALYRGGCSYSATIVGDRLLLCDTLPFFVFVPVFCCKKNQFPHCHNIGGLIIGLHKYLLLSQQISGTLLFYCPPRLLLFLHPCQIPLTRIL